MLCTLEIIKDNYYTVIEKSKYFQCIINGQNSNIYYKNYCMVKKGEQYLAVIDNNKLVENYPLINMLQYKVDDIGDHIFHTIMKIDAKHLKCDKASRAKIANTVKNDIYRYLSNNWQSYYNYHKNNNHYPLSHFTHLCTLASDYMYYNREPINIGIDNNIWSLFLKMWYRQHNLRILHNYGLYKSHIKNMELDTLHIYHLLTHNPYLVYTIPEYITDKIIEMNGLFVKIDDIKLMCEVGKMLRSIYEKYNKGFLCVSNTQLKDYSMYFSSIADRLPQLLLQCDKITNIDYYYLHTKYNMEQCIINKIVQLKNNDKYNYPPIKDYELDYIALLKINQNDPDYVLVKASMHLTDMQRKLVQETIAKVETSVEKVALYNLLNGYLLSQEQQEILCNMDKINNMLSSNKMSDDQLIAVQGSINNNISVITGPAGSGKSRCIAYMLEQLHNKNRNIIIGTPTGIAASRLRKDLVNINVIIGTLHSLIGFRNNKNVSSNVLSESYKLMQKVHCTRFHHLIIDEAGMVSYDLLYRTILTYPEIQYITLIGDSNQLQPINSPSLFHQLVCSNTIPVYHLWVNHRCKVIDLESKTQVDNYIIHNANNIIKHKQYLLNEGNFQIIDGGIPEIINISSYLQSKNIDCSDVTVICPLKAPLKELNTELRKLWNLHNLHNYRMDSWNKTWCVGDRVRMTVNNRDFNVYNGDEGIISNINQKGVYINFFSHGKNAAPLAFLFVAEDTNLGKISEEEHTIEDETDEDYNNELVTYHLQLSYALTIHSCQGAEYHYILMYIPLGCTSSNTFFNNSMLYTIITRAKTFCFCLANQEEMLNAIKRYDSRDCTHTAKYLTNILPILPDFITNGHVEISADYIPEIEDEYDYDYNDNGYFSD